MGSAPRLEGTPVVILQQGTLGPGDEDIDLAAWTRDPRTPVQPRPGRFVS